MNVCSAILDYKNGKILLVKNKNRKWELPGGKCEGKDLFNKDYIDVIKASNRELKEETGIANVLIPSKILYGNDMLCMIYNATNVNIVLNGPIEEDAIIETMWYEVINLPELSYDNDYTLIFNLFKSSIDFKEFYEKKVMPLYLDYIKTKNMYYKDAYSNSICLRCTNNVKFEEKISMTPRYCEWCTIRLK